MAEVNALARLVGDVAGFLDASWGRAPLHIPAADRAGHPRAHEGELLDLADVDRILTASGLRAPAFRLVRDGRILPQAQTTRRATIGSRPVADLVDVAAVHDAVADGATLVLQGLHRSFVPVARFCRELQSVLTHPVQANAYLTPPVAQGLELHEDAHDVFALQSEGRKRWVVHPPDGAKRWDLELGPGDVLYLPAGVRHAAQTIGAPSLHLTIGVRTVTWRRLVERTLAAAVSTTEGLGRSLPVGWADAPDPLEAELGLRLVDIVRALADPDLVGILRHEADAFHSSQPPDLEGGLQDLFQLDELDDRTLLRIRRGTAWRIAVHGDEVELRLADRRLQMSVALAPILRRIADAGTFRPDELDDLIDEPSRLVLCRRLVREGALTMVRDAGGAAGG